MDLFIYVQRGEVAYYDRQGERVAKVMRGLGENAWKGRTHKIKEEDSKPVLFGWKCMPRLPWRETRQEAEQDLEEYASKRGWQRFAEVEPERDGEAAKEVQSDDV